MPMLTYNVALDDVTIKAPPPAIVRVLVVRVHCCCLPSRAGSSTYVGLSDRLVLRHALSREQE